MQSVTIDQRVGGQDRSRQNKERRRTSNREGKEQRCAKYRESKRNEKRESNKPKRQLQEHTSFNTEATRHIIDFVSLVRVIDIKVLQELGAERCVGSLSAGQDLQHMAII